MKARGILEGRRYSDAFIVPNGSFGAYGLISRIVLLDSDAEKAKDWLISSGNLANCHGANCESGKVGIKSSIASYHPTHLTV
jgi:hypothetical protein